ncbi:alpha/beta hydrolase [Terrabacter sp. NPDC000476]|uniref:alpha/beta fold hydrolase n=1 Tax=Terrabacter sp. NPDC000476 TaxID=3154258 RepID=UPI00331AFDCE
MVTTDGRSRVRLPDGRRLDVWQGGDPSGRPVLFLHGTPGGRLQAALGDGPARRAGVRLLAFSRPGYGGSSDARTSLASVADDAAAVADLLGVDRFAVLGVSGGGPFALGVAACRAGRVTRVGVVAGPGPLLAEELARDPDADPAADPDADGAVDPAVDLSVDPAVRAALAGDHDAAVALRDAAAVGGSDAGPGAGLRAPVAGGFVSPEILEPWAGSGRPGIPPYRGASRDWLALAVGWDVDLADVRAPVTLWYGDRDRLVPPAHGRWLHERLPTSRLVVRAGEGHLGTLLTHWGEVLTELAPVGG